MSNIPQNLVTELMTLADKFEEYYRQDERQKVLTQLSRELFADKNGEKTREAARSVRLRRGFHASSKLGKLYRCLARRTYAVNKDTLIRETGMTKGSVYTGIKTLREKGYKIETVFRKGAKSAYKLAS
jgi:biotin operon repressor|tara:strand:- start:12 stop:395 length:384 start_codon:yes stop_codon:yes gene_type:complete